MRCVTNVKIRMSSDPEANGFGKGIVRLLEGQVWAENRPGGGCCFHVRLPAGEKINEN